MALPASVIRQHNRKNIICRLYWKLIRETANKNGCCGLTEARRIWHAAHPMKLKGTAQKRMATIVKKFFPEQRYSMSVLAHLRHATPNRRPEDNMSLALVLGPEIDDEEKGDICAWLMSCHRWDDLKLLLNDPIYAEDAAFELRSKAMSEEFDRQEKARH
jgi:hypothetical protein